MKILSPSYLVRAYAEALGRFPAVLIAATVGTLAAVFLIETPYNGAAELPAKILMTAALSLPLFLAAAIVAEKRGFSMLQSIVANSAVILGMALFFFTLAFENNEPTPKTIVRFAGLNLAAHLLVAFVAYTDRSAVADFWEYNKRLFVNFLVGGIYSGVIFAGLAIAITAVDQLFNLHVDEKTYGHLFVTIAGLFNTAYFLSNFPRQFEGLAEQENAYHVAIKNLSKFILIPIVAIYFLILYAYSAKILVTWELPKGWVASLVLGFSTAGTFTYLLNFMLVKFDDSVLVRAYRRWYFYVLLPMVALLFVGIGRRIADYGVTEERYVLTAAGVWLLCLCVYFIFSKKDNIKFIPISLAIFATLAVLGPLNAFRVSKNSQVGRLKNLLEKNGMFADGKAVPAKDSVSLEDKESFRSILVFLDDRDEFEEVATWFGVQDSVIGWELVENIASDFNIGISYHAPGNCYYHYPAVSVLDITGYEKLWEGTIPDQFNWRISDNGKSIEYYENNVMIDQLDLGPYLKKIYEKYACNNPTVNQEDSAFEMTGQSHLYKIVPTSLHLSHDGELKLLDMGAKILVKKRQ